MIISVAPNYTAVGEKRKNNGMVEKDIKTKLSMF